MHWMKLVYVGTYICISVGAMGAVHLSSHLIYALDVRLSVSLSVCLFGRKSSREKKEEGK